MTEVEFPKPPRPSSSTWSLGSNQYAPGKFPKVSISVPAVRLSQENKINPGASLQNDPINHLSQEPKQWVTPRSQNQNQNSNPKIPNSNSNPNPKPNPNPNPKESILGKRKEPVQETGANNTVGLRMKLLEILNAGSQKEPTDSPQIQNQNSQKEGETLKNPNLNQTEKESAIKLSQNQNKGEKGKLVKENNPFSDPIETDSDSSKRVEARPVTRSLSLKKNSTFLNKGTNGGSKRAKVEPRKLNFPKKPPVSGKNAKKPPYNENEPQKTPSHNTRDTMKTSSNKTNNNNKEKENSWDFPVTPVVSNNEQENEVLSPKFGRNRRVFGDLKDSFANITNSGISLQKRKPVEKPAQKEDTRVSSALKGSSAIKTNTGASKQKPSAIPTSVKPKLNKSVNNLIDSPVISEDIMQVDPTNALNASVKPKLNVGLSSVQMKKPVVNNNKLVESPVTSEDIMQVDKEAGSKGSFVNRINSGVFIQRNNSESPVTSEDVQPEKEAERENETKGSFANKINPGGNLQNENWADVERNKSVSGGSKGSFVNNINSGGFMQRNNLESPVTSEDVQPEKELERKNDFSKGSFANKINPGASMQKEKLLESPVTSNGYYDYHKSPTFAMNGTSSSKKGFDEEISVPVRNPNFSNPKISNPKSSESSQCSSDSDPDYELSEDTRDSNDLIRKKVPNASPIEDLETQSIGINSFLNKGYRRTDNLFSDLDMPIKSPPIIKSKFGGKLVKEHEKREDLFPETPIGTDEENNGSEEMVNQFPENDLASAVCQLAAVLKRFKAKIKTNTNKKSAEILSLTAEKIQEQLKDAQVQMQEDIRKFMGCSNSKRKQLELKFQEQAEKLKMIHDKFREEINQQLIECKSSFAEFEAYQMELKGVAEKQKAMHRKLLSHVEEGTKTQLSDAEKKISLVHREAHKKMSGLKRVLKQWIPEGAD